MNIPMPFNLQEWIDNNRDILKPPVGNKCLYKEAGDFIVMVVGGPNARKDYHYNEGEEWFYQVEGDVMVKIQVEGKAVEVPIKEGEMFLLPGNIPHSPIRGANTVGLVIEKVRKGTDMVDGLMWFCDSCNHLLHEYKFELVDIENDFQSRFKDFYSDVAKRTCSKCGTIMEIDERFA
jgi:3-hydroxyanthranilate 3,4-dioxygenase